MKLDKLAHELTEQLRYAPKCYSCGKPAIEYIEYPVMEEMGVNEEICGCYEVICQECASTDPNMVDEWLDKYGGR